VSDRFTAIADTVSEALGAWWFSALSLITLAVWIMYGAYVIGKDNSGWFTSTDFNFPLNTITTVGEWFIGALVAAAANRVEKRNREINDRELQLLGALDEHVETSRQLHERTLQLLDQIEHQEQAELQALKAQEAE
jgi:uncharacterized membrane protein